NWHQSRPSRDDPIEDRVTAIRATQVAPHVVDNSCLLELALFCDPLVRFSGALDPVRELAGAVRKLANDLVGAHRCHPRAMAAQLNFLADSKPVRRHARLHCLRGGLADGPLCSRCFGCRNGTIASSCRADAGASRRGAWGRVGPRERYWWDWALPRSPFSGAGRARRESAGIAIRISFSMARKCGNSSALHNEIAVPAAPARAVRPMRCT